MRLGFERDGSTEPIERLTDLSLDDVYVGTRKWGLGALYLLESQIMPLRAREWWFTPAFVKHGYFRAEPMGVVECYGGSSSPSGITDDFYGLEVPKGSVLYFFRRVDPDWPGRYELVARKFSITGKVKNGI